MKRGSEESIISRFRKVRTEIICVAIFLFCLLYPLTFYNFDDVHAGDIAEYVNNPLRVLQGDTPYTEFWLIFPPLEVYYPALLYAIFGVKMFALFISSWVFGALATVMVFLIGLQLMKNKGWALLSAFVFFFSGMISHYSGFDYGGHIHLFFLLLAAFLFIRQPNALSKGSLILIGAIIGIAAGFRIDLAGAFFVALVITLIYMRKKKSLDGEQLKKYLVNICLGCLVIFALIYLPFGSNIPTVINEILIKPPVHATNAHVSIFGTVKTVAEGFGQGTVGDMMTLFRLVYDIVYKILPISTLVLFLIFLKQKPFIRRKIPLVFFMLWALLTLPKVLAVPDVHYLSVLNSIIFIPFLILTKEMIFSEEFKVKKYLKIIFVVMMVILLVAVPASRAVDYVKFASKETFAVRGAIDTLYLKDAERAAELQSIINTIENKTWNTNNKLFVTSFFAPPLYEMTGLKNPTYYDSIIDLGFVPDNEKQRILCNSLDSTLVHVIVHGKECQLYWNGACVEQGFDILDECLKKQYRPILTEGKYVVYLENYISN